MILDQKIIDAQLKNFKVREGPLYKRSKFLKQWRERWIVLTMNYFFTFTNKTCQQVTDVIDLKEIKSYKSYVRKDEQMIPAGFKIRSQENMYYFCARNCNEKWSWLVTFQRIMDYKYAGASTYNNLDFIKTKGFLSQTQFEAGSKYEKSSGPAIETGKDAEEAKKDVDNQAEKILKQLMQQQEELKKREQQFAKKQKELDEQEAMFVLQKDKIKKTEAVVEKEVVVQKKIEQKPVQIVKRDVAGSRVSDLKSLFEKKMEDSSKSVGPVLNIKHSQKQDKNTKTNQAQLLHLSRNKVVTNLFEEFNSHAYEYEGLKYVIDFLIKMTSDRSLGYQSFVIYEAKTNDHRQTFAQIFIELLTDYKDYENADLICRFVEVLIFEAAGVFNSNQLYIIQNKLLEFFFATKNEKKLGVILKSMFILHKIRNYPKNQELKIRLNQIVKECKEEQTRNWGRKLNEEI